MARLSNLLEFTFRGLQGNAATVNVGSVSVINPNVNPSIVNAGTLNDAIFNFNLPRSSNVSLGTLTTLNPNQNPSLTNTGANGDVILNFSLPRTSNVSLGTLTTLVANAVPTLTNSGTNGDVVLNFSLPRSANLGLGSTTVLNPNQNPSVSNTTINGNATFSFSIPRAANVSIGTVSTLNPEQTATVTNSGTNGDVILNFSIPRGNTNLDGIDAYARTTSNSAYSHANGSFNHSNAAFTHANSAFNQANTDVTSISTTAGTYGSTIIVPVISVVANGRVLSVSNASIAFPVTSVGGSTSAVSNTQLLDSIKSVDGAGSGLDADLLDGLNSTQFANSLFAQAAFNQANTDVTSISASAGTYGNTTAIPVITIEANGRVRTITTSAIVAGGTDNLQNVTSRGATTANAITITNSTASISTTTGALIVTGGVGIGGALNATTKSFNIPHPTKKGKTLRYGSLEGPEYGVYVRGQTKERIIKLPTYWTKLVDANTITVNLTPIGSYQELFVEKIEKNKVYIKNQSGKEINCFFTVFAERADVDKLEVE